MSYPIHEPTPKIATFCRVPDCGEPVYWEESEDGLYYVCQGCRAMPVPIIDECDSIENEDGETVGCAGPKLGCLDCHGAGYPADHQSRYGSIVDRWRRITNTLDCGECGEPLVTW